MVNFLPRKALCTLNATGGLSQPTMKNVLKSLITVSIVAAFAVTAIAQGPGPKGGAPAGQGQRGPGGGMGRGMMNDELMKKLNLTAKQKTQIEALQAKMRKEMEALRPKDAPGGGAKPGQGGRPAPGQGRDNPNREKMRAAFEKYQKEFLAILTPEQKAIWEKEMKEMRERFRQGRPGGARGGNKPAGSKPPL